MGGDLLFAFEEIDDERENTTQIGGPLRERSPQKLRGLHPRRARVARSRDDATEQRLGTHGVRHITQQRGTHRQRVGRVVQAIEVERRELGPMGRSGLVGRRRQTSRPERGQIGVPALLLVETLQGGHDLGVLGPSLRERGQVVDRAIGIVGEVASDLGGFVEERVPPGRILLVQQRRIVEGEQLVPAFLARVQERQTVERPLRARRGGEDLPEHRHERRLVLVPLVVEARRPLSQGENGRHRQRASEEAVEERGDIVRSLQIRREIEQRAPGAVRRGVPFYLRDRALHCGGGGACGGRGFVRRHVNGRGA